MICASVHQRRAKPFRKLAEKLGVADRVHWHFALPGGASSPAGASTRCSRSRRCSDCSRNVVAGLRAAEDPRVDGGRRAGRRLRPPGRARADAPTASTAGWSRPTAPASSRARSACCSTTPSSARAMGARRAAPTSPSTSRWERERRRSCAELYLRTRCKLIGLRRERRQGRVQGAHRRAAGDRRRGTQVAGAAQPGRVAGAAGPGRRVRPRWPTRVAPGRRRLLRPPLRAQARRPERAALVRAAAAADPARGPGPRAAARRCGSTSPARSSRTKQVSASAAVQEGRLPQGRRHVLRRPVARGPRALRRRRAT